MKLLIDDANIENIKYLYEYFPVSGVTTNPSILSKVKKNPVETLSEIRDFIGKDQLHVQVLSKDADDIIKEARLLVKHFGSETFIKVPTDKEGLKAIKELKKEGINITATAIYSPNQAYLAALAGADFLAPYVNRIDNLGFDGLDMAMKIQDILDINNLDSKILAASFKNSNQVLKLAQYGIAYATCSKDVFEKLIDDKNVLGATNDFTKDFRSIDQSKLSWLDYLS